MNESKTTKNVIKKQWTYLGIIIVVVLFLLVGLVLLLSDHSEKSFSKHEKEEKLNFSNPLEHIDAESVLLEKTQQKLNETEKKTDDLKQQLTTLESKTTLNENKQNNDDLQKRIAALEQALKENKESTSNNMPAPAMEGSRSYQGNILPFPSGTKIESNDQNQAQLGQGIREDILTVTSNDESESNPLKNPDTYVPAGTFVKAVMIGGADASAAVNASSDPLVMLFRITENGTLPNHRKSHLKDCVALASVWGDISSERGEIRLVNLSCTFTNNEIVDQAVEGTVFGPEGKNGVRGIPVWREGALLQRAFAAGTLSGLSDGLSQTYSTNSISADGNVQTINPAHIFQYGAAKGAGKAMDKLADYNIQRAEQYHPVIQLSAGTVVDIVFQKGFFLDGKKHENKDVSVGHYENASMNTPTLFPQTGISEPNLPLSDADVRKIQEKSKELGLRVTPQVS